MPAGRGFAQRDFVVVVGVVVVVVEVSVVVDVVVVVPPRPMPVSAPFRLNSTAWNRRADDAGVALVYWPELGHATHRGSVALGALFTAASLIVMVAGNLVAHRNHERKLHGWATMAWSMG